MSRMMAGVKLPREFICGTLPGWTSAMLKTYIVMRSYSNQTTGILKMPEREIAERAGLERGTMQRAIAGLKECGMVVVHHGEETRTKGNWYVVQESNVGNGVCENS